VYRKILFFVFFFLLLNSKSFGRSSDYYTMVITNILTECTGDCRRKVLEQEIQYQFISLLEVILKKLDFELSQIKKDIN